MKPTATFNLFSIAALLGLVAAALSMNGVAAQQPAASASQPVSATPAQEKRPPLVINQRIPLPGVFGRFDHFTVDTKRGRDILAALGNDSVVVVDGTARIIANITGLDVPQGVLYIPALNKLFVSNQGRKGNPSVTIYDGDKFQLLKTLEFDSPDNFRYDEATKIVYVSIEQGIAAIDAVKLERLPTLFKLPEHGESFQLEKNGSRIFVNLPIANSIAVIDRKTGETTATWKVPDARTNFAMALDETNHRVFSVFRNPSSVKVLDTETGKIVVTLPCVVDVDDIFYDATRKRIYVTGGEGFVDVFQQHSPDSYTLIGHIPTGLGARTSIMWETRTRQGMTIAVPAAGPDGSGAILRAQFID